MFWLPGLPVSQAQQILSRPVRSNLGFTGDNPSLFIAITTQTLATHAHSPL